MSGSTNETEDGDGVFSMDSTDSPLIDEGNSGGSIGGAHVLKKGPWTPAEDAILVDYVKKHGEGNWNAVQRQSGLFRCGKSCRLRWANHLRPNLKKGAFTPEEEHMIIELHSKFGNKWARMASHLSGRTDNEIKNYWNTRIKRRQRAGLPIYPANVQQQGGHESENNVMNNNEIQTNSMLKNDSFDMSNDICEGLKTSHNMFAEMPCLPDISPADILTKSFSAPSYFGFDCPSFPSQQKDMAMYSEKEGGRSLSMVEQAKAVERRYALSFPYKPPNGNERLFHFVGAEGRCSLPNCTISSSSSSRLPPSYGGCLKSELPSFQYQQPYDDYGGCCSSYLPQFPHGSDPSFLRARASPAMEPGLVSSPNSGLLDALLHESYNLNHSSEQSTSAAVPLSEKASSSAPVASSQRTSSGKSSADTPPALMGSEWNVSSDTEREEYWDMFSGMDESVASIFYDSDQNMSIEGLMEERLHPHTTHPPPPFISGCNRKQEEVQEYDPGGLEDEFGGGGKENVMTDEVLACFLGRKVEGNGSQMLGESYEGGSGLSWSVLWNNMPPIFQIYDHNRHF